MDGVYQTVTTTDTGFVNIQLLGIQSNNVEIRAKRDISINLQSDFAISGYIGGVDGFDKARDVSIQLITKTHINPTTGLAETGWFDMIDHQLSVSGGLVSAQRNMVLQAGTIASDSSSVFIATELNALARNAILLNTLVGTITAVSTAAGSVTINEADDLIIKTVSAYNGAVSVSAG